FNMFPKESVDSMKAAFTKQAEYFTDLNQKYIDSISKQIAASKSLIDSSVTEKIKKEVEKNIKLSQEALQSIVDNYNKVVNPSIESNKKNFNQLNEQIESSLKANLKLWSKFLNNNNTKETEKKDESAFAEKSHNGFDKNANSTVYPKNKNLRFTSNNKK
ncbi:MAG TPA: hypothetical protein VNG53_01525, partial [Bacteroidia bacterium]|nr:hypothetical protein [Bacteroidia bacterium]